MRTRMAVVLLLLVTGLPALRAQTESAAAPQAEESVDSNQPADTAGTITTSTTTTSITVTTTDPPPPSWIHLVRLAAVAGPIAFLVLAWGIGALVHYRIVRREQEQFPVVRGSRTPQTAPMFISAGLFFVPAVLFAIFEIRSRLEIRRGIGGVVDEWQPVTAHAWTALLVCLVLALLPWLFARRADTVA
ncbi:MAG TPA: hypothetical protein VN605_12245 [Thermoanaerobaculia bacterium]|nr:hypothetical protein [Thermoanaerobaculia bacterium]